VKNEQWLIAFGVHLRRLRERNKMSLQNLADEADISKITIYRIENAKLNPTLGTLISLAQGLNISLKELTDFKVPQA